MGQVRPGLSGMPDSLQTEEAYSDRAGRGQLNMARTC